jgi:hypothetical protein
MRNTLIVAAALMVIATPALADEWDFVLINNSGKQIKSIEIAPAGTQTWQKNKVDEGAKAVELAPGKRSAIHFDKGPECRFDIKGTFADDTSAVWTNVNVCDNAYVTLKYNAAGAPVFTAN